MILAVYREDLAEAKSCRVLDTAVQLDERHFEPARQTLADAALACATHAERAMTGGSVGVAVVHR
jgi:hypothetical protein